MDYNGLPVQIVLALLVDALVGDPRWLPHPVRCIGVSISSLERLVRRFCATAAAERMAGGLVVAVVVSSTYLVAYAFAGISSLLFREVSLPGGISLNDVVIATAGSLTMALRGLRESVKGVLSALEEAGVDSARRRLSHIVGRDTEALDERGILRAAVETLSENASDGVIAPMFYFALGGFPLAMAYKAVNTLDSMLGYRNDRYLDFGYAAARLDDMVNYIPARLTAWAIISAAALLRPFSPSLTGPFRAAAIMMRDGGKHSSPNAGRPEAAMAGVLGIRLGGPASYGGVVNEKPFIGGEGREVELSDGFEALRIVDVAAWIGMVLSVVIAVLLHGS